MALKNEAQLKSAFEQYCTKRGYELYPQTTAYGNHGVKAKVKGNANRRHFTQAVTDGTFSWVRLSEKDFQNQGNNRWAV